jgi:hypothetical protein
MRRLTLIVTQTTPPPLVYQILFLIDKNQVDMNQMKTRDERTAAVDIPRLKHSLHPFRHIRSSRIHGIPNNPTKFQSSR